MLNTGILTISDKGSRGERRDDSGMVIRDMMATLDSRVVRYEIVPDEADIIAAEAAGQVLEFPSDLLLQMITGYLGKE